MKVWQERSVTFSVGLLVGWVVFFFHHRHDWSSNAIPPKLPPEATTPSPFRVDRTAQAGAEGALIDTSKDPSAEKAIPRKPNPIKLLLARYRFPTLDFNTLEFSESLAEDLQLAPDQITATKTILQRTLESLKALEKKHVTVEVTKDGGQTLVINPFDSTSVLDALGSELKEALDAERADLLKSLIANDRLFGHFGLRRQKICAENVIHNQGNDAREIPVIVMFDSIDEQGQYIHESTTLTQAMYLKRYGELVSP